jgi:hypothetical protein
MNIAMNILNTHTHTDMYIYNIRAYFYAQFFKMGFKKLGLLGGSSPTNPNWVTGPVQLNARKNMK